MRVDIVTMYAPLTGIAFPIFTSLSLNVAKSSRMDDYRASVEDEANRNFPIDFFFDCLPISPQLSPSTTAEIIRLAYAYLFEYRHSARLISDDYD